MLLAASAGLIIVGSVLRYQLPPPPPAAGLRATPSPITSPTASPVPTPAVSPAAGHPAATHPAAAAPELLPYSVPVSVSVPAIGVRASIVALGENPDHTVQVPPLSKPEETSWFDLGPAPGQQGPAVLFGHVNTAATGPAIFYKLGDLKPGDTVMVTRADHQTAVFRIDRLAEYKKVAFPSQEVYGQTANSQLRLVTCGGAFDPRTGHYLSNIVAYATLASVITPAPPHPPAPPHRASPPHPAHPRGVLCVPPGTGVVARLCS